MRGAKDACDAKIPKLDETRARQEDVPCLEVTVEDVVTVKVLWGKEEKINGFINALLINTHDGSQTDENVHLLIVTSCRK